MAKRRLKPTEVRAVAALLDSEADSVEELAERVVRKITEMREGEQAWVVAVTYASPRGRRLGAIWGPYTSQLAARRAAIRHVSAIGKDSQAGLFRLVDDGELEIV